MAARGRAGRASVAFQPLSTPNVVAALMRGTMKTGIAGSSHRDGGFGGSIAVEAFLSKNNRC